MMRSRRCDPQIGPLHDAEMEFYPKRKKEKSYAGRIRWNQVAFLVRKVRRQFSLPPVRLTRAGENKTMAQAWVEYVEDSAGNVTSATITLDTYHEPPTIACTLHELAHVIVDVYFENHEDHGREFVGVMSWLYDYYHVIPADALGLILRRHKIKRRPLRFCSPKALCDRT